MFFYGIPKDSQVHFGDGEAGKSAMDTRAAYMIEVINEMYVNQRIKLEWNIVGIRFLGCSTFRRFSQSRLFPAYGIQTVVQITKNMSLKQMNAMKHLIKEG
jgi:hypothetical protein